MFEEQETNYIYQTNENKIHPSSLTEYQLIVINIL